MKREGAARSIWANPNFGLLWGGQFVSAMGTKISGLALPLLALGLTHSPAQAGFIASARMLPYLVLGLPAGALVDRWDKRRVLIVCDLIRVVALGWVPLAWALGCLHFWQLYAVAICQGTAFVFFNVAEYAALTRVVSSEELATATALDSTAWTTASLIGPGVAGGVISLARNQVVGAVLGYFADSFTFLISVISLLFLRLSNEQLRPPESVAQPSLLTNISQGLTFVARNPSLRTLAVSTALLSFLYAPVSLAMIVLAKGPMGAGPASIGLLFSIAAGGGLVGSLIAPAVARKFATRSVVAISVLVQATVTGAIAFSPNIVGLTAGWTVAFLLDPVLNTSATAFRLRQTAPELQARVQSIFRLGGYGGDPLGAAVGGLLIARFGPRPEIAGVAIVVAAVALFLAFGIKPEPALAD